MIGLAIGLILIGGMTTVFVNISKGFRQDEQASRLHDDLRIAFAIMAEDIEMAGYWSDLHNPYTAVLVDCNVFGAVAYSRGADGGCDSSPTAGTPVTDPLLRWTFFNRAPLAAVDNVATTASLLTSATTPDPNDPETISLATLGLTSADIVPGTDVIAVKRLLGGPTAASNAGGLAVQTAPGGATGTLFPGSGTAPDPDPDLAGPSDWNHRFRVAAYFIRPYALSTTESPAIPTLCRRVLQSASSTYTTECLAQGIENLQLEYGVDTVPAAGDGVIDRYVASGTGTAGPTQAELGQVIAVRIALLGRNQPNSKNGLDYTYKNQKTYAFGNTTVNGGSDPYYRKLLQGVVLVRNPSSLNALAR